MILDGSKGHDSELRPGEHLAEFDAEHVSDIDRSGHVTLHSAH